MGHKSKGFLGTWKACLSEHSQDCAGTLFRLSFQSGEIDLSQDLGTDHWSNLSSFFDPGHDPRSLVTPRVPPHHCWSSSP